MSAESDLSEKDNEFRCNNACSTVLFAGYTKL